MRRFYRSQDSEILQETLRHVLGIRSLRFECGPSICVPSNFDEHQKNIWLEFLMEHEDKPREKTDGSTHYLVGWLNYRPCDCHRFGLYTLTDASQVVSTPIFGNEPTMYMRVFSSIPDMEFSSPNTCHGSFTFQNSLEL